MEQIAAFLESDSGQALLNNLSTVTAQVNQAMKSQAAAIAGAALKIYCADPGACPTRPAALSPSPSH